jgi:hypothetical protein
METSRKEPMELSPEKLQAILDLLVESGVEEFEGFGFHVRFTLALFEKDNQVAKTAQDIPSPNPTPTNSEPTSLWESPELWPGGKPPSFPGKSIK